MTYWYKWESINDRARTSEDQEIIKTERKERLGTSYANKETMIPMEAHKPEPKWQTVPMFTLTSAKRIRAVNMEARRQAVGVITKVAKLTLNEGPPDPRLDTIAGFDRCCDRKYTREERMVRMTEIRMP